MSKLKGASAARGDLMGPFLGNIRVEMGSLEIKPKFKISMVKWGKRGMQVANLLTNPRPIWNWKLS